MAQPVRLCTLSLAAITAAGSLADAAPAHNVCVPVAVGVPSRGGPPRWLDWGTGTPGDEALDDPRWLGATGHSFQLGGARAPLLSRALWANMAGKDYLLLSFIVDLEGLSNAGAATPRDLFLGFRRPSSFAGTGGAENAYIFQFHLTTGASASLVRPAHCSAFNTCDESSGAPKDFWRVFVDRGATGACGATVTGEKYERFVDSTDATKPPISWVTAASPGDDAVRFWKLDASQPPVLQNRWAVQLRIPIAANDTSSLEQGIPPSSTFWYQGSAALTTAPVQLYASLGWWPRELTTAICPASSIQDSLVHSELATADKWSRISRYAGARPADCDTGLTIETRNIGAVFNAAGGTDFAAVTPTTSFKAGGINTVIAQVQNLSTTTDVTAPLMARFRLAGWGSAPWITPTEKGVWKDMRGAENGVCGAGSPPGCSPSTVPHLVDVAPHDGLPDAGTNNRAAMTFQWTIGNDLTLGASEFCKFGLKPPDVGTTVGACVACSCGTTPNQCDATTDTGTKANVGAATPCVSTRIEHQCMFVELTAPNGGVDFVQESSWNNMNFDQMSTISREGLIDARQLPRRPGQRDQDIYLLVMPRNMPGTIPGGAQDGAHYVREKALERAEIVAAPYLDDLKKMNQAKLAEVRQQLGRAAGSGAVVERTFAASTDGVDKVFLERVQRLAPALQIMSDKDVQLVTGLVQLVFGRQKSADLNVDVVATLGPDEAAGVVPTLEIYPFYQPYTQSRVYLPMTAFSVFLGHEGAMSGIDWEIDGATKVGQNIYHLDIPVGYARKIRVRAQAIQPPEPRLPPSSAAWPCTGCCPSGRCGLVTQVGNTLPGVIAGVFVIARRRKRKPPPAA